LLLLPLLKNELYECSFHFTERNKKPEKNFLSLVESQTCDGQGESFSGKCLSLNSLPEGIRSTTAFVN